MHTQTIYQLCSRPGTLPAIVLQTSCKTVTPWQKVRGNVIPLVGFGDLQPLSVLAKMKSIWRVARKDRWNTGSHTTSCWEAIVVSGSELHHRAAHPISLFFFWEGCSPLTYSTVTKCKFQTSQKQCDDPGLLSSSLKFCPVCSFSTGARSA